MSPFSLRAPMPLVANTARLRNAHACRISVSWKVLIFAFCVFVVSPYSIGRETVHTTGWAALHVGYFGKFKDEALSQDRTIDNLLGAELTRWIITHPKHAEFQLLAPGLVYARIHGGRETFSSLGICNLSDTNGERDLHFVTACGATYHLHVIGGGELFTAASTTIPGSSSRILFEETLAALFNGSTSSIVAYINGGFYNRFNPKFPNSIADTGKPEHATIGYTRTIEGIELPFIDPPVEYEDKYETLRLSGNSVVTSAPVIARNGDPVFTEIDMVEGRFKYNPENITPGLLNHAEHPNPRAAVIVPTNPGRNANFKLMAAFSKSAQRGAEATGFTMVEWAKVAARLSRLGDDEGGSVAINLDGGASTVLGTYMKDRNLLDVRQNSDARTSYFVAITPMSEHRARG